MGSSVIFWGISVLLCLTAWSLLVSTTRLAVWLDMLALGVVFALLTISLEHAFSFNKTHHSRRYRLAFLASIGLYLLLWSLRWATTGRPLSIWLFGAAFAGAFLGGLAATALRQSLWEDNSPPSELVKQEVHQRHLQVIGQSDTVPFTKRAFDICLALAGLLLSSPVWILSAFLVWFEDPGPIFFVKNSVGLGGVNFHQLKFRSMVQGAEEATGPVLASDGDARVLAVGKFLRKTALDELPQLVNILRGEMSFVGPRPQRTVLVRLYLEEMPEYAERHRVLPGLAGLAQVVGHYYLSPRQKLRLDRLYIRNLSLGFDIKLLCLAFLIAFWYRWQPGWDGRLPGSLVRFGSKSRRPNSPTR
jgi:lipopolysaccharide/colanic/teichoic acid biosynthesis glycosyltransferase